MVDVAAGLGLSIEAAKTLIKRRLDLAALRARKVGFQQQVDPLQVKVAVKIQVFFAYELWNAGRNSPGANRCPFRAAASRRTY
jgi:hypothetical protein